MRPVRLKHAWGTWSKGHVFTQMPAAQAQMMVIAGQAEYADGEAEMKAPVTKTTTKEVQAPVNRMMESPVTKKPGKPDKRAKKPNRRK